MNKKRIAIYLFFIICLVSTSVFAAVQASLSINASSTKIKPGDEITVVLNVKDITGTTNGFRSFDGYIEYNKDVFETVKNTSLSINGGSGEFNQETGKFAVDLNDAVLDDAQLISVKLKVKSNASAGDIKNAVIFKDIKLATGLDGSITLSKSLDITILENSSDDEIDEDDKTNNDNIDNNTDKENNTNNNDTNTDEENNANTNEENNNNNNNNTNTNKENNSNNNNTNQDKNENVDNNKDKENNKNQVNDDITLATKPLPHTGVIKLGFVGLAILVVAFIYYRKYKNIEL